MQASVIISYYNNIPDLELLLLALNEQTAKGMFEVIVSEDGEFSETVNYLNKIRPSLDFPLQHTTQPDKGFRKCKALNNAILHTRGELIIFIDGDCMPHKKMVEEYVKEKSEGRVLYGRRVMLSKKCSEQLFRTKNVTGLNVLNLLFTGCKRIEEGLYIPLLNKFITEKKDGLLLGCNMAINKKDILAINGFDEDYEAPGGGEDTDIEWRLKALGGISFHAMKHKAIVYHIYHPVREIKIGILHKVEAKIKTGAFFCKNGIKKIAEQY